MPHVKTLGIECQCSHQGRQIGFGGSQEKLLGTRETQNNYG